MTKHKVEFEGEDLIRGRNCFDLDEDGDFRAAYILVDEPGDWNHIALIGYWRRYDGSGELIDEVPGRLDAMIDIPTDANLNEITAGQIVSELPWEHWIIEEIQEDEIETA